MFFFWGYEIVRFGQDHDSINILAEAIDLVTSIYSVLKVTNLLRQF
jgi:hypothetical protein